MSQTKIGSFTESLGNIAIGFFINFTMNLLVLPRFGFATLTLEKNFAIGMIFTFVSVVRSYALRRFFNQIKSRWNSAPN